jgi:hypothetical protein
MARTRRSRETQRVPGFDIDHRMGRRAMDDTSYVVRKTTDLAVGGGAVMLGVGALGAIGSILKK